MPITHYSATGQSLYVMFNDSESTAVNMTEGTGYNATLYTVSDAAIAAAGLAAGSYTYRILVGAAATKSAANTVDGIGSFSFNGTEESTTDSMPYSLTIKRVLEILIDALLSPSTGAGTGTEVVQKYDSSGDSFTVTTTNVGNRTAVTIEE